MYTTEETDLIVADSFAEMSYKQKCMLLAASGSGEDAQKYSAELIKTFGEGVYNKITAKFSDEAYREKILSGLDKKGIVCITERSNDYPEQLENIPSSPLVLYCKGNAELLKNKMLAVVGSRRTMPAVLQECKAFCREISRHMTIVTGVADGADSAALSSALENGNAICVLPGGHSAYYSPNRPLIKRAEQNGLVLSEFPPSARAQRHTFVLRNRVIAALCKGVLVVSAPEKSGALSTANYAVDFSKDIFAFPYAPGVESGKGCNNLIKDGAMLCDSIDDILSAYGFNGVETPALQLSEEEAQVIEALKENGAMHAQKIAEALNKKLTDVITICSLLEIKGLIVKSGANTFSAINI